ncbi:MAG: glycosyltransferase family 39 protein, partial [Acidimicrobiales bacterium]
MNLVEADVRAGTPADPSAPVVVGWDEPDRQGRRWTAAVLGGAMLVCVGVALRLWSPSPLWLDEAQAVAIARLPLGELLDALRQDGAPPLYYLLLHGWMRAFGTGAAAVRLLSVLLSLGSLVLAWQAAVHLGGRRVGAAAVVLLATSPFAIRYASEARMYSLILVLAMGGLVLVLDPRPLNRRRSAGVGLVVAALLLTHYWSFVLVAALVMVLGWRLARRRPPGPGPGLLLAAVLAGAVPFLPWVPSLLFQLRHTGAPWAPAPGMAAVELAIRGFAGGDGDAARLLELLLLAVLGWFVLSQTSARLPSGVVRLTRDRPWPATTLAGLG